MLDLKNSAQTTLTADLNDSDETILVADYQQLPATPPYCASIDTEIVRVYWSGELEGGIDAVEATRGVLGTTKQSHSSGTVIANVINIFDVLQFTRHSDVWFMDKHLAPYLYYTFDESTPPYKNHGNAGTLDLVKSSPAASIRTRRGIDLFSAEADKHGTPGCLTTGDTTVGEVSSNLVVQFWVYLTHSTSFGPIVGKIRGGSPPYYWAYHISLTSRDGDRYGFTAGVTVGDPPEYCEVVVDCNNITFGPTGNSYNCGIVVNSWHYIALSRANGVLSVYSNGQMAGYRQEGSTDIVNYGSHGPLVVLGDNNTSTWTHGRIDNLYVMSKYFEGLTLWLDHYKRGIGLPNNIFYPG